MSALFAALTLACSPPPPPPPPAEPPPELTPFIPTLKKPKEKPAPPTATFAPSLSPTNNSTAPHRKVERRVVQLEGGLFRGSDIDTIDQIDAAFVTRVDLLATADDGPVEGWFLDGRLIAARASIGSGLFTVGYFDKTPRPGFYDFEGMGMDGKFRARPVPGSRITSRYGLRFHPIDKTQKKHKGTDFGAPTGTPIYATAAGRVATLANDQSAGIHIKLEHESGETLYLHMSETAQGLKQGDIVKQGQEIGKVGTTGKSTGPHLHYELRYIGIAVDSTKTIPRGQTALSPSEKLQHQERLRRIIDEARP